MSARARALGVRVGLALVLGAGASCVDDVSTDESDVIVKTETEAQWEQYVTNVDFVEGYLPRCGGADSGGRPRVLVTGFGRFLENKENATGRMVAALVPGLEYPLTSAPEAGEVDDPQAQTRVARATIALEGVGEVDVCGMVLPVFWDVAALLVLAEVQAFEPDMVLMNGIAGARQPLWLELGSVNEAVALPDGSGTLAPVETGSKLVEEAPDADRARGLMLSWEDVKAGVEAARAGLAEETDASGFRFGDVLTGVRFAGFPRSSNTYLCNNTTYAVNYLFDHPGQTFRLLRPSHPREGGPTGVDVTLTKDFGAVPRVFAHWAKDLQGPFEPQGAAVMRALIAAQLGAATPPRRGDNELAEVTD